MLPPSSPRDVSTAPSGKRRNSQIQKTLPRGDANKNVQTTKDTHGGVTAAVKSWKSYKEEHENFSPKFAGSNGLAVFVSSTGKDEHENNTPVLASSPQLTSLGGSPPTQPSSSEDQSAAFDETAQGQKPTPNGHPLSLAPPSTAARIGPISHQTAQDDLLAQDDCPTVRSPYPRRRSSMHSHVSQNARFRVQNPSNHHPQLPHFDQPHFYGAPDVDLLLSPNRPGLASGERGFYCGFDELPVSPMSGSKSAENVVLNGYEGGLDIYKITRKGLSKTAGLEGLRGGVYYAKVLPWMACEFYHQYPLIALVTHGPGSSKDPSEDGSMPSSELRVLSDESVQSSPRISGRATLDCHLSTTLYYQTTVEIYSLSTKKRLTTLLTLPETRVPTPRVGTIFRSPQPLGALVLHADASNIVISSGKTGESWVFRSDLANHSAISFKCICKLWTTVQDFGVVEDKSGKVDLQAGETEPAKQSTNSSILSLKGRYLAYCPPNPSSQNHLQAMVPDLPPTVRIPGLNTLAPPQLPQVTCSTSTPGGESMFKGIAKIAMQELSKGASYAGEKGLQYWNSYWNKPAPQASPTSPYQAQAGTAFQFPPTHGAASQIEQSVKDPGIIAILDLDVLAKQHSNTTASPHPVATFKIHQGCSFLSFSPNGLNLFTASTKGDIQIVWDLMLMQYAKSTHLQAAVQKLDSPGPHIRQIAQFSRMTIARIVEVVWASPQGERAAMITEPGTVHVLDIPASAFTWPPPRMKLPVVKPHVDEGDSPASHLTVSGAVSSIWNSAKPFVGATHHRRSSASMSAMTAASVKAQAGHGTQVLVAGISRSVGAATGKMKELRKSNRARLHLPRHTSTSAIPGSGCVRYIEGRQHDSIFVLGSGIVGIYDINSRKADRPAEKQQASRGAKYVEFKMPSLPDHKHSPVFLHDLQQDDFDLREQEFRDPHWQSKKAPTNTTRAQAAESSIPQAEIESNAPYQPFHTDRRVGLHVYSLTEEIDPSSPSVSTLLSAPTLVATDPDPSIRKPWAFGDPILSTKLDVGLPYNVEEDEETTADFRALPSSTIERILKVGSGEEEGEQIVVTTRRRKVASKSATKSNSGAADEVGFFEDDCDVVDFATQRV